MEIFFSFVYLFFPFTSLDFSNHLVGPKIDMRLRDREIIQHKNFDDASDSDDIMEVEGPTEELKKLQELVDMEGSSGDEAPQEESTSSAKEVEKLKVQREEKALEVEHKKEKERRRKTERKFKEQKRAKQLRQEEQEQEQQIPNELPVELLEDYKPKEKKATSKGRKIKFEEVSTEDAKIIRMEKLKEVRNMNKEMEEKGPVMVKIIRERKYSVPVSEISSKRDKWLQRRSIMRR
ncbi:hypothetical protein FOA43_001936 [Brettanomyces nanus]|uniref:Uncharacterized protein n=1 Tax=Eeniella nana TaxID=13502 RepID=A0A875S5Y7_EENNA|nr:uncharacterized protein FOA43_001936 [Brettanomyces nanus]QPG74604.1 hypothetical protein FOA43_001936 [Brettanomyces nanus]